MHRVELKVFKVYLYEKQVEGVPNAPCGVESRLKSASPLGLVLRS